MKFEEYKTLAKNKTKKMIKILRMDNGGEYDSLEFLNFFQTHGIFHQFTIPCTLEQNGVVEQKSHTIVEVAHNMLHVVKLFKTFWVEAISTTCYIQN